MEQTGTDVRPKVSISPDLFLNSQCCMTLTFGGRGRLMGFHHIYSLVNCMHSAHDNSIILSGFIFFIPQVYVTCFPVMSEY